MRRDKEYDMTYETNYDVIVLGGGFTGCAAAVSAARLGRRVLLLEASGFLGGAASNNLIFPLMPYSTTVTGEDGEDRIEIRPMMNIRLSADHRLVDGMLAAEFVHEVKRLLEEPTLLLL